VEDISLLNKLFSDCRYVPSGGGRSLGTKISGGMGRPWGTVFGFYKTRHILLSDSANCTMLRGVVLTQYRRVTDGQTDGQTDGIAIASAALAMRALWRAVKTQCFWPPQQQVKSEPHQTWHGDRGPRAHSCTSKTSGVRRIVSPIGGAENFGTTRPPQLKAPITP